MRGNIHEPVDVASITYFTLINVRIFSCEAFPGTRLTTGDENINFYAFSSFDDFKNLRLKIYAGWHLILPTEFFIYMLRVFSLLPQVLLANENFMFHNFHLIINLNN